MLPGELLITKTKKGRIYPVFAAIDEEHQDLAGELIEFYRHFEGKKKSEIDEIMAEFEQGLNFKLVRGLRTLLERRCIFKSKFAIEPMLARRAVFETASSKKITNGKERAEVIEKVAKNLNISVAELEQSLWADHESELVLEDFAALTPEELLKLYNLSLAQTLLFKATGMVISFKSNYKWIFRAIKYLGLMYSPEGNKVRVEGASSLLKLSERYGTSLAKLLPVLVNSDEWEIDAEIVVRRDTPKIYHFVMDSRRDRDLLMCGELKREEATFDSSIEERFYNEFLASLGAKSWELVREPDAVFTEGKGVFIPDFKFKHKEMGIETYFEIVGFWTEEYLKKKLSKLRAVPFKLLVAIDRNLACFNALNFELSLNQPLILYSRKVPVGDVLRYLAKVEREEIEKQMESLKLRVTQIELEGDIIPLKNIAMRYNVSKEAVRACLNNQDYVVFKEVVVKKELLSEVKEKLASKNIKLYVEARRFIEDIGIPNPDEVLAELGFTVKWRGLDVEEATIGLR